MTTITMTFDDLFGRTQAHVRTVQREMRSGRAAVSGLAPVTRAIRACLKPVKSVLATVACRFVDRHTRNFVDQAVWFAGIPTALEKKEVDGAFSERAAKLASLIEAGQDDVMRLRGSVLRLAADFKRSYRPSRVAVRLQVQAAVLADLFDAMEQARWAVLDYEADVDIAEGRVTEFESVEAMLADLKA